MRFQIQRKKRQDFAVSSVYQSASPILLDIGCVDSRQEQFQKERGKRRKRNFSVSSVYQSASPTLEGSYHHSGMVSSDVSLSDQDVLLSDPDASLSDSDDV